MKRGAVLVTGGAGLIGSNLVRALRRQGRRVIVADNLWRGSLDHLRDEDGRPVLDLKRDFHRIDLRKARALDRIRTPIDRKEVTSP